jgi:hypothetical protein
MTHEHELLWPALQLDDWRDTEATLHMWTQLVGKIRLALTPRLNHWWNVPLYVGGRGLSTSLMHANPLLGDGSRAGKALEMRFDFVAHELVVEVSDGSRRTVPLVPRTVASFYEEVMEKLAGLGVRAHVWTIPVEVANPIPFELDTMHATYVAEHANRFWRVLVNVHRVFERHRARFIGKCSPIHFFWGGFDLAVTRFSGRPAPEHPPVPNVATSVVREAYSHEVWSAGFWPGMDGIDAGFFAYAYPEPKGFARARMFPEAAYYHPDLREWFLPYEAVRTSSSPDDELFSFLESTYESAADLARWDRDRLESPAIREDEALETMVTKVDQPISEARPERLRPPAQ